MSFVLNFQCLSQGVVNARNRHRSSTTVGFPTEQMSIYGDQISIRSLLSFVEGAVREPKLYFLFVLCMFPRTKTPSSGHRSVYLIPPRSLFRNCNPSRIYGTTYTNPVTKPRETHLKKQRYGIRSLPIGMQLYWVSLHVKCSFQSANRRMLHDWAGKLKLRTKCTH